MTLIPTIESYHKLQPSPDRQEGGSMLEQHPKTDLSTPLVTIVTVVYNGEAVLEETILSVLNQTYKNIEYIIIDGHSTDRTLDIIKKYDRRISHWVSEPDNGLYDAMNRAIVLASGTLVGIVNAGDYYTEDAVEVIVNEYQKQKVVGLYSGDCKIFLNDRNDKWVLFSGRSNLPDRTLPHGSTFVPLALYAQYGLFDTSLKISADYELLSRFYKNSTPLFHIPKTIVIASAPGVSSNHFATYTECFIVRLRHHPSIIRSILISASEFIKVAIRTILERINLWYLVEDMKNGTVLK
jgi:glycosyltransferase involved in cell wall biosynthesis